MGVARPAQPTASLDELDAPAADTAELRRLRDALTLELDRVAREQRPSPEEGRAGQPTPLA